MLSTSKFQKESKKAYSQPKLTVYGRIEDLTQGVGGNPTDGQDGSVAI